eukprot:m51a1_g8977 hypothetical protein (575) ;mRNA; r:35907-38167
MGDDTGSGKKRLLTGYFASVKEQAGSDEPQNKRPRVLDASTPAATSTSTSKQQQQQEVAESPASSRKRTLAQRGADSDEESGSSDVPESPTLSMPRADLAALRDDPDDEATAAPPQPLVKKPKLVPQQPQQPQPQPETPSVAMPWEGDEGPQRWDAITRALARPLRSADDVEAAVKAINGPAAAWWDFSGLRRFCEVRPETAARLFASVLPRMAELVRGMREALAEPLPVLRAGAPGTARLTRAQAAALMAGCFFCVFPGRSADKGAPAVVGSRTMPSFSFRTLFQASVMQSKLLFLFHYFERVTAAVPRGRIEFERRVLQQSVDWQHSKKPLCQVRAVAFGSIEDSEGCTLVDFANKIIGGGVFGKGAVQEEICFLTHPELIVSRLLCEQMRDDECIVMRGAERFSLHSGYSFTLSFAGDFQDKTPQIDGLIDREIVAIDAVDYMKTGGPRTQFDDAMIHRELDKAYIGFTCTGPRKPIATGNWGCGVFGGNKTLKALVQLLAASECGRPLVHYLTFGDGTLSDDLCLVWDELRATGSTVGDVWSQIDGMADCARHEGTLPTLAELRAHLTKR